MVARVGKVGSFGFAKVLEGCHGRQSEKFSKTARDLNGHLAKEFLWMPTECFSMGEIKAWWEQRRKFVSAYNPRDCQKPGTSGAATEEEEAVNPETWVNYTTWMETFEGNGNALPVFDNDTVAKRKANGEAHAEQQAKKTKSSNTFASNVQDEVSSPLLRL